MEFDAIALLQHFDLALDGEITAHPYGDGHINDTYLIHINDEPRYILQHIRTSIFHEPELLMENVSAVCDMLTDHLRGKKDASPLQLVRAKDGKPYYRAENGEYYRIYVFIPSRTLNYVSSPSLLTEAARAFGQFQRELSSFPAEKLHETIRDFHNTPVRFRNFRQSVERDACGRADSVRPEIAFALSFENKTHIVTDGLADGSIPLRVTHNDTKLNNVLFDRHRDVCISVIDLDTVMPGSLLYDFGDALRFAASSAAEDEKNLNLVWFRLDLFEAFARGYLLELLPVLTPREIELLPFSAQLMTYECGIRFLGDYLDGDVYFKTAYPGHNLDRARNQFKLVADMETKLPEMKRIIDNLTGELAITSK